MNKYNFEWLNFWRDRHEYYESCTAIGTEFSLTIAGCGIFSIGFNHDDGTFWFEILGLGFQIEQ